MRAELIDAAEELIREEGYPAVTSRTLADKVGLKRQIVHYYFKSMDDVFIAVVRRAADRMRESVAEAAASDEPLRELQRLNRDPHGAILSMELHALANRRPAVRAEVARAAEEFRDLQTEILNKILERQGVDPAMRPVVAIVLLSSLAQVLALESAIDISRGHAETLEFVDECLRAFAQGQPTPLQATQTGPTQALTNEPPPKRRKATVRTPAPHS
ncbi:TetR/AcrR family transcriptional regulator [Phenylobacterium sp. LjRoot225]|uniref:TetR/AcrR family transcriptional regulator n=1 Tax=Phenylobacterium sp. LjRoot225 TaxID=3342285 RepID=UPI003ECE2170